MSKHTHGVNLTQRYSRDNNCGCSRNQNFQHSHKKKRAIRMQNALDHLPNLDFECLVCRCSLFTLLSLYLAFSLACGNISARWPSPMNHMLSDFLIGGIHTKVLDANTICLGLTRRLHSSCHKVFDFAHFTPRCNSDQNAYYGQWQLIPIIPTPPFWIINFNLYFYIRNSVFSSAFQFKIPHKTNQWSYFT